MLDNRNKGKFNLVSEKDSLRTKFKSDKGFRREIHLIYWKQSTKDNATKPILVRNEMALHIFYAMMLLLVGPYLMSRWT